MRDLTRAFRWLAAQLALMAGIAGALAQTTPPDADTRVGVATFAGGCFWCVEEAFEKVPGVIRAVSGYTGGTVERPTYEEVSSKSTGHYEAVQVTFDPTKVSYAQLVDWFWRNIDPFDADGQFCDKGSSYHTAIFTHDAEQLRTAEASKQALEASGRFKASIATKILPAEPFWVAEDYHRLLQEEPPPLSLLQDRLRARSAARGDLGAAGKTTKPHAVRQGASIPDVAQGCPCKNACLGGFTLVPGARAALRVVAHRRVCQSMRRGPPKAEGCANPFSDQVRSAH